MESTDPGGVLPYMGYIGYGFSAVLVINWVSILATLLPFWSQIGYQIFGQVINRVGKIADFVHK